MGVNVTYYLDGFQPDAPAQNRKEEWDDDARCHTVWDEAGNVTKCEPYTEDENAEADASVSVHAQTALVTVQVDPNAVTAALEAGQQATNLSGLRDAFVALAEQLLPADGASLTGT